MFLEKAVKKLLGEPCERCSGSEVREDFGVALEEGLEKALKHFAQTLGMGCGWSLRLTCTTPHAFECQRIRGVLPFGLDMRAWPMETHDIANRTSPSEDAACTASGSPAYKDAFCFQAEFSTLRSRGCSKC